MNVFEESIAILKSKVKLRTLFKHVHIEDLEGVMSRLQSVYDEKRQEVEQEVEANKHKIEALQHIVEIMKKHHISQDELIAFLEGKSTTRKRRNVRRCTFRYETEAGSEIIWEGSNAGRIPTAFRQYLDRTGKRREDCVVNKLAAAE